MDECKELCQGININSLAELYMEDRSFVARGRACFEEDRVYLKMFDPTLKVEVGDVFVLRFCSSYVYGQLISFVESVGEFIVLKGGELSEEQKNAEFSKDALILFENSIHKDRWGTLLVEEPYFLARVMDLSSSGAKLISSADKNINEDFYLALQVDLFECVVGCKILTKFAIDEYAEDFVYELEFVDMDEATMKVLDSLQEA